MRILKALLGTILIKKVKNLLFILFGWGQILIAIFLKIIGFGLKGSDHMPYSYGFIKNLRIAVNRYSYSNLFRRFIFIYKMPKLGVEYFNILITKKNLKLKGNVSLKPSNLIPQHGVTTDHLHHKNRVKMAKSGGDIMSGSYVVVINDNKRFKIMDGHHRVNALIEAGRGNEDINCTLWEEAS